MDYSKNRITDETLTLLIGLAEQPELRTRIDAMFRGEKINATENRAALRVALRAPKGASIIAPIFLCGSSLAYHFVPAEKTPGHSPER